MGKVCFHVSSRVGEEEVRNGGTSLSVKLHHRGQRGSTDTAITAMAHFHLKRRATQHVSPTIVYSLLRNVNLFALRCAALPLVFVVFSPLLSPFSLVDCRKIKATPLEQSEYFRCGERTVFHTTCAALRDRFLLSLRLS